MKHALQIFVTCLAILWLFNFTFQRLGQFNMDVTRAMGVK